MKFLFLFFISFNTFAQSTFYVANNGNNANTGTVNQPWETIQFGVSQVNPGDQLIVKTGSYNEAVLIQGSMNSGTQNNKINITAQDNVVIDGKGISPVDRQGLITIRNASYIIIDGFELSNFKTADGFEIEDTPVGILIEGNSTNIVIKNNKVHDIQNRSTCGQSSDCGPGANGIAVYGDGIAGISDIELINNEVFNCVLAASESFTINGNVDRFKVINNFVHDNNNIGFDFIGYETDVCSLCNPEDNRARNGYIKGNRSINNSIKLSVGGFPTNPWYENDDGNAGGFYVDGGKNIIFDGNISSQNDLGFEFASEHAGRSTEDILMVNNYIYNNKEVGLTIGGFAQSTSSDGGGNAKRINIINNSFYHNQGWGTEINFAFRVIDFTAANNIFFGTADVNDNFAEENNSQSQNINWSNNIWWAVDNSDTSLLPDPLPIIVNPTFVNPSIGNLRLSSTSDAINIGSIQADIITWNSPFWDIIFSNSQIPIHGATDINGELRVEGTSIDIGADEFGTLIDLIYLHGFE